MSKVYVVQNQHRLDRTNGTLVPKFDLKPAEAYGQLEYLLNPSASPFRPEAVLAELHAGLANFGPQDFLLLIGNPVLIGLAVAIAADLNDGQVKLLQWSGKDRRYIPIEVSALFTFPEQVG